MFLLLLWACATRNPPTDTDPSETDTDADSDTDTDTAPGPPCGVGRWSWGAVNGVADADASYQGQGEEVAVRVLVPGDLDGDGADDLVIGAPYANLLAESGGALYLVLGEKTRERGQPLQGRPSYAGDTERALLSPDPSPGDVDGDGLVDLVVEGFLTNTLYLVRGRTSGWAAATPVSAADVALIPDDSAATVGNVGDVDGDGLDDWVLERAGEDGDAIEVVPVGSATGDLRLPDDAAMWVHGGDEQARLAGTGDLDGDGVIDIVGNYVHVNDPRLFGVVYGGAALPRDVTLLDAVDPLFESDGGPEVVADVSGDGAAELVELTPEDGAWLHLGGRWSGTRTSADADVHIGAGEVLRRSVNLGDVDGDGLADLGIIRLADGDVGSELYVFLGRAAWPTELPLVAADAVITRPAGMTDDLLYLTGGDFDGDGLRDLVLAAVEQDVGDALEAGVVWIVRGRLQWPAAIPLEQADASIAGDTEWQRLGINLDVGDLDADGCDDLVVSDLTRPAVNVGETFVFYGQAAE